MHRPGVHAIIPRVKIDIQEALQRLSAEHRDYNAAVYKLLHQVSRPPAEQDDRFEPLHISIKAYYVALLQASQRSYGPMAYAVFCHWGIHDNKDLARALRHLVEAGLLLMSPGEAPEDFHDLPSLQQMLEITYTPKKMLH